MRTVFNAIVYYLCITVKINKSKEMKNVLFFYWNEKCTLFVKIYGTLYMTKIILKNNM